MKISSLSAMMLAMMVCSVVSVGCAGLSKSSVRGPSAIKSMLSDDEPEFFAPSSMVAIWKPSTYQKPGTKSLRGFGGRFYFHDAQNLPVKVDGTLTIYGYDDAEGETTGKADRKFVFESSTLQKHHSASGLGDSYSFWVPWDEVGGVERTITLIPVFKSIDGKIPESKPATLRLPGKKREVVATAQDSLYGPGTQVISASGIVSDKPMVQQAVAISDSNEINPAHSSASLKPIGRRKTTTFTLPQGLANRIAQLPPERVRTEQGKDAGKKQNKMNTNNAIENAIDGTSLVPDRGQAETRTNRPVFGQPGSF